MALKRIRWYVILCSILIVLFIAFNLIHYAVFKDSGFLLLWNLTNLAFLPISVLFVSIILEELLSIREKRVRLEKLNIVIGIFFSNYGTELLSKLISFDKNISSVKYAMLVNAKWSKRNFTDSKKSLKSYNSSLSVSVDDMNNVSFELKVKEDSLLRLLENPYLSEHAQFTELLRALLHLREEFACRKDLSKCPPSDFNHIVLDLNRVYLLLIPQWLDYMHYLKENYAYLFSLAMRRNPFDTEADVIIK
jgi:hypothetical protein